MPVKKGFDKKYNAIFLASGFCLKLMLDKKDIRLVFQSLPVPCVLLSTAVTPFIIEEVSGEWLKLMNAKREEVIGKELQVVLSEHSYPVAFTDLADSLSFVLCYRKRHRLPVFEDCSIAAVQKAKRFAAMEQIPVIHESKTIPFILHLIHLKPGTDSAGGIGEEQKENSVCPVKEAGSITGDKLSEPGVFPGHLSVLTDITQLRKLEDEVREAERNFRVEQQRFSDLFREAPVSMCIFKGEKHVYEKTNALYNSLVPPRKLIGRPVREVFPELEGQDVFELLDNVYRTGETFYAKEKLIRFDRTGKGEAKDIYLNFIYQPYKNANGVTEGIFYFGVDITEQVLTRKKVEESERRYRQIVETSQEGIWLIDEQHHTLFVNRKMAKILGYKTNEISGKSIFQFVVPDETGKIQQVAQGDKKSFSGAFELQFISRTGEKVWGYLNTTRMEEGGVYKGFLAMVTDISERKVREEELKRLSLIARSTTNAIVITNAGGIIEWVNEAFSRMTEFTYEEVVGKTSEFLYGEETDEGVKKTINQCIEERQPFQFEVRKHKKSGAPFWVEVQGRPVFHEDGTLNYYFRMGTDITERKLAFQKLLTAENQVRRFARQLNRVLEEERSHIAREIHDEFGQQLMGLKMSLSSLCRLKGLPAEGHEVIQDLLQGVEATFLSLRNFSNELRPGILDTLGLAPSIKWLAEGFEKKSGIPCSTVIEVSQQVFEKELSTNFFRICQEALTNILKHAEATEVGIELREEKEELVMKIEDNGKGIRYETLENPFSVGLLGMQERARLVGGRLDIRSTPGEGTCIQLRGKVNGL